MTYIWSWIKWSTWFKAKPTRHTIAHQRRPCVHCGREVAHTKSGQSFVHRCKQIEICERCGVEVKWQPDGIAFAHFCVGVDGGAKDAESLPDVEKLHSEESEKC
jgi:hypothetical protein